MELRSITKRLLLTVTLINCAGLAMADTPQPVDPAPTGIQGVAALQATDLATAEKIFQRSCRGCHGNKGQGASSYPSISDKEPEYLADRLTRYRAGEKFGPNSVLMINSVKKLTDEDIINLSVYVATAFD